MTVAIAAVALIVATMALAMATGVSLGRNGDREDVHLWRHDTDEAMHNLDERLRRLEPDENDDGA